MILGTMLIASDKQRQQAFFSFFAIPLNIVLNYFLINYYQEANGNGAIGAAIATGITEISLMVGMITVAPRSVFLSFRYSVISKSLIAGGIMATMVFLGTRLGLFWIVQAALCPVVFVTSLYLLNVFEPGEKALIKDFLSQIPGRIRALFEK